MGLFGWSEKKQRKRAETLIRECEEFQQQRFGGHIMDKPECSNSDRLLDLYLDGTIYYQGQLYDFPEKKSYAKAVELIRADEDPENREKMKAKFGRTWGVLDHLSYLAVLSPDEEERKKIARKKAPVDSSLAYYVYRKGFLEEYFETVDARIKVLFRIAEGTPHLTEERPSSRHGRFRWEWQEILGEVPCKERKRQALEEIKRLQNSPDPKVRDAAQRAVSAKMNQIAEKKRKEQAAAEALWQEQSVLYGFMQDELGVQLVDQEEKKVHLNKDGTVTRKKD